MRRYAIPLILLLLVITVLLLILPRNNHRLLPGAIPTKTNGFPVTIDDALNKNVIIAKRPERIISLAPSVTETIYAIGAGDRLIADTSYCDYPAAAQKLAKIGGFIDPNVEKIAALKPDLVIGSKGNPRDALQQLTQLKIPVVIIDPETLDSAIDGSIRTIGKATGMSKNADKLADDNRQRKTAIARESAKVAVADRPRTLLLFSPDSLFSAGTGSYLDEMITLAGGVNIAGNTKLSWPELSMEKVIKDDPQIIMILSMEKGAASSLADALIKKLRADRRWRQVSAVQKGNIVFLGDDELTLPGPRLINGLAVMAREMRAISATEQAP